MRCKIKIVSQGKDIKVVAALDDEAAANKDFILQLLGRYLGGGNKKDLGVIESENKRWRDARAGFSKGGEKRSKK